MSDPRMRPRTRAQIAEGVWRCTQCGCINDPDETKCWSCDRKNENTALNEDSIRE